MRLDLIIPILYIVFAGNIILGITVVIHGLKRISHVLFSLMSLFVAVWGFAMIGFHSESLRDFTSWVTITHVSAVLVALVLCYLSLFFPNKIIKSRSSIILISIPAIIISFLLANTDLIVVGAEYPDYLINNVGYVVYSTIISLYFLIAYLNFFKQYRLSKNENEKQQVRFVALGAVLGSILALVPDLLLPAIGIYKWTWLGPIVSSVLIIGSFVAIIKYGLFNIKLVIAEIIIFSLWIFILIRIFLSSSFKDQLSDIALLLVSVVLGIILIKSVMREVEQNHKLAKVNTDLGKANDRLKELDQLKSEFVSLATHQIRGPLTAIKGYASMIIEGDYGEVSEKVKNAVSVILQSSVSLVLMVGDFLDVSRIEQGRMKFNFTVFDLKNLAKDVIKDLEPNIKRTGLSFDFVCDESKEYLVDADLVKIKQVAGNLIDNSIKYTQKGGIIVKVEKMANKDGDKIRFSVKDTGVGVPKELMPKLFEKFSRAENANEVNIIGTGLGLYLAKEMINAHGGKIWVESEGNEKGSTFIFELDAVKD